MSSRYWFLIILLFPIMVWGQMNFKGKQLFGNEWIKPTNSYYKISISSDGMYKISYQDLKGAGISIENIPAIQFRLIRFGEEVDMIASTDGLMTTQDYFLFYGVKNRGELDNPLYNVPTDQLNAEFSMFTDEAIYYVTWENSPSTKRVHLNMNDISNPIPKDDYYICKENIVFSDYSHKSGSGSDNVLKIPLFDDAQGYSSEPKAVQTITLDFPQYSANGPEAKINITNTGYGEFGTTHRFRYFINNELLDQDLFSGFKVRTKTLLRSASDLMEELKLEIHAVANPDDKVMVSVISKEYPRQFIFNQGKFAELHIGSSIIRKFLVFEDFDGGSEMLVYDLDHKFYVKSQRESDGTYKVNLPESSSDRKLIIFNPSEIKNIAPLKIAEFENFVTDNTDYLIIYHKALTDDGKGNDYVQEYIRYRSSVEGGSYAVKAIDIEKLYDQFAYGTFTHPLAVKNMAQYVKTLWPNLKFAMIIGKGLEYHIYRKGTLNNAFFFVPSFSYPASDAMLFSGKDNLPFLAFGRLPAINGTEINTYLDKVKSHENYIRTTSYSIENREWLKNVVHLSGGDPQIYQLIRSQLEPMKTVIENNLFGGNVTTFNKENSGPTQIANNEILKNLINNGSAIIAFMGHSGAVRLDFNLENVDSYKNKDRYHVFIAMGCYAGQMFWDNRSISEDHNLAKDKGSIIYVANSTAGYPDILGIAGSEFYRQLGGKYFGKSVGEALSESLKVLLTQYSTNDRMLAQALSTIYDGDPAIQLNINTNEDYTFDPTTAQAEPNLIFSSTNEFTFNIDALNLGKFIKDSVLLTVENEMPNGLKRIIYNERIASFGHRKSLSIKIPIQGDTSVGYNTLYVKIDGDDKIVEGPLPDGEKNNELVIGNFKGYKYYVIGNEAKPIYPVEFSIINQDRPILIANNGNTLAKKSDYYFELDTTGYFNSPIKKSQTINQTGGVISWNPNINLLPNIVYYWRIAPDSIGSGVLGWRTSSFIYLPNSSPGWNQSHYFQFIRDDLQQIKIEEPDRTFQFTDQIIEIRANNGYIELPTFIRPRVYIGTDVGIDYEYWKHDGTFSGVVVNVFDPLTGKPWINVSGRDYESYFTDSVANKPIFIFKTNTIEERGKLIRFLSTTIPSGHVVIFNTLSQYGHSYFAEEWETDGPMNLFTLLESYGSKEIRNLRNRNSPPYILIFRKGRLDFEVKEVIGNLEDEIELSHSFTAPLHNGRITSTLVGPAKNWGKFLWDFVGFNPSQDKNEVNIFGIDKNGISTHLYGPFMNLDQDLIQVDAQKYPKLKLEWFNEDPTDRSLAQMKYWRVLYEGLPDAAWLSARNFVKSKDTLNQGDLFKVSILAQNISNVGMDSLLVKYTLVSTVTNTAVSTYKRFIPLSALATIPIPYEYNTSKAYGNFKLYIELNPDGDQPEAYSFNNTVIIDFFVRKDKRKPYLDVTFDGNRIINEEIVSNKSVIEINLSDESKDNFLNDTSLMNVFILYPDQTLHRVYYGDPNVEYVLGGPGNNELKLRIRGDFTEDGVYTLQVRGEDATGNTASDSDYLIDFTIITTLSMSNVFNYPNPFTSKTKFLYTLTGTEIPENYSIQIMTISGKVVKQISKEELGPLMIGTHMTEYEYDGTDDFGEKLANGVYLYRFNIRDSGGKRLEKYNTHSDDYFKNDFGKMVLIR